jgi:hypothetical protein
VLSVSPIPEWLFDTIHTVFLQRRAYKSDPEALSSAGFSPSFQLDRLPING